MQRLLVLSAIIVLVFCGVTTAQADSAAARLSVADAIALSLDQNVNLKASVESHRTSLSRLRIAGLATSYSVGSNMNFENSPDTSQFSNLIYTSLNYNNPLGTSASLDFSPVGLGSERGAIGLSVRHPLMKGRGELSTKGSQILSAMSDVTMAKYGLYQSRQDTVIGVIEAYYEAVLANNRVKVEERAVSIAEELLDGTRKRGEAGLVTGIELSRAEINVARTKDNLNLQRETARGALDHLMLAIGSGIGQTPELTDSIPESVPEVPTLDEAVAKALANRSELHTYDERIVNQERDVALRHDELKPALDAVVHFNSTMPDQGVLSTTLFNFGSTVAGVELRLPLDSRAIMENRGISERQLGILKEQRTYEKQQIAQEVRSAYRTYDAAKISLGIYGQNLAVAEEGLRLAKRMVEEGEGSNREVLDAQQALTDVQSGLLSAKNDLYIACIRVKLALGEDLTTMGSQ